MKKLWEVIKKIFIWLGAILSAVFVVLFIGDKKRYEEKEVIDDSATGTFKKLDSGFPKIKGSFGVANGNVVLYRASFAAGDLNANGINEVALMNGNTAAAKCLAYAQITPSVNVTSADSLQIDWQITVSGS